MHGSKGMKGCKDKKGLDGFYQCYIKKMVQHGCWDERGGSKVDVRMWRTPAPFFGHSDPHTLMPTHPLTHIPHTLPTQIDTHTTHTHTYTHPCPFSYRWACSTRIDTRTPEGAEDATLSLAL